MKPILKWIGGKTQIIDILLENFPKTMENYHEIFLGGGSVLFNLLMAIQKGTFIVKKKLYAYDVNEPLIYVYKNIQKHPLELYNAIMVLYNEYNACDEGILNRTPSTLEEAQQCKENYYYWTRMKYNMLEEKTSILGSALFIFLNKTCFRGMFRMGPKGFNVPYGNYKNPEIVNKEHLLEVSELIKDVEFGVEDFQSSILKVEKGDFVYLDPPYAPESASSFVGYTKDGFNYEQHAKLFTMCDDLVKNGKCMIMSNADVEIVGNHFTCEKKYKTQSILCKRSIHSKNPGAKAKEVIIIYT